MSGHCYSLIQVIQFVDDSDNCVRLCCLRNPWGKGEWKGDWSDSSDFWTDRIRNKYNVKEKNDGIFYMSV